MSDNDDKAVEDEALDDLEVSDSEGDAVAGGKKKKNQNEAPNERRLTSY